MVFYSILGLAVNLANFNIDSLGLEGTFDAMSTGEVDENWAKHHHSAWAAESEEGPAVPQPPQPPEQQPAE